MDEYRIWLLSLLPIIICYWFCCKCIHFNSSISQLYLSKGNPFLLPSMSSLSRAHGNFHRFLSIYSVRMLQKQSIYRQVNEPKCTEDGIRRNSLPRTRSATNKIFFMKLQFWRRRKQFFFSVWLTVLVLPSGYRQTFTSTLMFSTLYGELHATRVNHLHFHDAHKRFITICLQLSDWVEFHSFHHFSRIECRVHLLRFQSTAPS